MRPTSSLRGPVVFFKANGITKLPTINTTDGGDRATDVREERRYSEYQERKREADELLTVSGTSTRCFTMRPASGGTSMTD